MTLTSTFLATFTGTFDCERFTFRAVFDSEPSDNTLTRFLDGEFERRGFSATEVDVRFGSLGFREFGDDLSVGDVEVEELPRVTFAA